MEYEHESSALMTVTIVPVSLEEGSPALMIISPAPSSVPFSVSWYVSEITMEYTEFTMASGTTPLVENGELLVECPPIATLKAGFYKVDRIDFRQEDLDVPPLVMTDFPPCLFEIREGRCSKQVGRSTPY